ncbi:MAG: serine/threonine-protein kinase [Phycisphaerales bacterium]
MKSTPRSVKDIFSEAIELPAGHRAAFLAQACGDDRGLRGEIEELLAVHDRSGDFLGAPTLVEPRLLGDDEASISIGEAVGTVIGRYRLMEEIGEGGFGTVYMAEQQHPVRRMVALKIIKLGMDTKQVIARFEAERQALAMMDHPNIAKVLDAGATETGRPYFVMELVKGIPLGEYCDEEGLSTVERLKLFVKVCHAVQHAHQKGIIHRDIKPSNVMVTMHDGVPVPKVIDFGIAKATNARLTEKTLFTEYRQLVGTPEYMSPEQAEMSDLGIDTRSDIYSLGVLLYELLTGTTPFDSKELRRGGFGEIQRIICEQEPPKPSTRLSSMQTAGGASTSLPDIARNRRTDPTSLRRSVRGDLDWIVMKAMEKDRTRRYATAQELAQDIERHLHDEPVAASPPSASYRLHKMVRRNRGTFVAASLVMGSLVLGIAGTSMGMVRAVRAERLAEDKAHIAESVNEFLNHDLLAAVAPLADAGPEQTIFIRRVLDVATTRIDEASRNGGRYADEPLVEAQIRGTLSDTYRRIGAFAEAEPHARREVEICIDLLGADHPKSLRAKHGLATVFSCRGRFVEAEVLHRSTFETQIRVLGEDHPDTIGSMNELVIAYCGQGRFKDAEPLIIKSIDIERRLLGDAQVQVFASVGDLVQTHIIVGGHDNSIVLYEKAIEIARRTLGDDHPATIRLIDEYNRVRRAPTTPRDDSQE